MKEKVLSLAVVRRLALAWVCGALSAAPALADPVWFTIAGDEHNPSVDTVQFDPTPIAVAGARRMMNMRASRGVERLSAGGIRFRSYSGVVEFDCDAKTARFVHSDFFMTPLWQGAPYHSTDYGPDQIRPMRLSDFKPNPTEKIVRAACPQ